MLEKMLKGVPGKSFNTLRASRVKATTPKRKRLSHCGSYQGGVDVG
ncbi:MAG: hypothetical protein LBB21_05285 [Holosporaceae bacterium]|jgi:hypothetical protein|nr:hypothetical protein [Holosporaceae bacterium]